jgi:hypothetical protein
MTKKKPKRGRPRLPAGEKRATGLLLKLRQGEQDAYRAAADRDGLPLAVWARQALDRAASRGRPSP